MEVLSTTNPLPPSGGTNTSAPLSITASMSDTVKVQRLLPGWSTLQMPILLDSFQIKSSDTTGHVVYNWSTRYTKIADHHDSTKNKSAWALVEPYYSKMCRMEYLIILKPFKVADAEVRLQAFWNYTGDLVQLNTNKTANHNEVFQFDDSSDEKVLSVPQFFMHDNVTTNKTALNSTTQVPSSWVPDTRLSLVIVNPYQPNLTQPDSFEVQVFLMPVPTNMKVIAARRPVKGTWSDNTTVIVPTPYYH